MKFIAMVGSDIFWKGIASTCSGSQSYDRAYVCLFYFDFIKSVEFIKLADFDLAHLIGIVMVDYHDILIYFHYAVINLAYADTAYIFIVIYSGDKHLGAAVGIAGGSGDGA